MPRPRVDIEVEVLAISDTSLKVQVSYMEEPVWLPKSEIDEELSDLEPHRCCQGDSGTISIPEWLALNRGIV